MKPDYLVATALAVPTLLLAAVLSAAGPRHPAFPFAYSLAEAIQNDDIEAVIEFLRNGQDPNSPIWVRHATLTGGRTIAVPPLIWAVGVGDEVAVTLLIGLGASLDGPASGRAACLADALGEDEIAETLRRYGRRGTEACNTPEFTDAPLLWWAEGAGTTSPPRQPTTAPSAAPVPRQPPLLEA